MRRRLLPSRLRGVAAAAAFGTIGGLTGAAVLPPAPPDATSGMFRGGPDHAGTVPARGVPHVGGLLWRFQSQGPVRSSPTLAGDAVFVGSGDGNLYALDAHTGRERWRFAAGAAVSSGPAVTSDAVFFTALDGSIYAVARRDGKLRWRVRTGAEAALPWGHEGTDYYSSSLVVAAGLVIVGSGDGSVYALDAASGRQRWRVRTGGRVRSSPAVVDGTVYVGSFDGVFYTLDARTGAERWRYATEGASLASQRYGYDRRSIQSSPAVAGGTVYVGSRDGHLYALGASDGTLKWRYAHDATSWAISSPAVRDSVVFEGSSDAHFFHAIRAGDGTELWRVETDHSVWSSPVVAGSLVYMAEGAYDGAGLGAIHALDAATGEERWSYRTGGGVLSSPAVGDGMLVVGSDDGGVYALRDGEQDLARAVFWDSLAVPLGFVRSHTRVRDYLSVRGYEVLRARALRSWMEARVADRAPSVVVFAIDYAPRSLASTASDTVLLRRYLDAGGKVVWLGLPPRMWVPDSTGSRSLSSFGGSATSAVLGVSLQVDPFDAFGALPTPSGQRWGLAGWWMSAWGSPPPAGVDVLATDERGHSVAWVRAYGGPPGTGFVQLGRPDWDEVGLRQLAAVAEYRPAEARR
jgi:eukaryotic-like serine/threonine-protein kinase